MGQYQIENWLNDDQPKPIEYSEYWNDEELEKDKEWYILDGNFSKMEDYLNRTGLTRDLQACIDLLKNKFKRTLSGTGIDLASGNLWAVPHLLRMGRIDKLYCLEYSRHRLLKIGPEVLKHYQISTDAVVLIYGNFYHINRADGFFDFIFLSAAFHHADKPADLLREMARVLKPGGIVIMIGENRTNYAKAYLYHLAKYIAARIFPKDFYQKHFRDDSKPTRVLPHYREFLQPDLESGDHYYTLADYQDLFSQFGFSSHRINLKGSLFQSFVLVKE